MPRRPSTTRAFTLIELLVVVAIIATLIGILMPALGSARESSRRLKCLANLKGIGQALALYSNDSKGLLPKAAPLHTGDPNTDPSLLDLLADYIDAPVPHKGDDDLFIVTDPYKCPSDRTSQDADSGYEPVYRSIGTSYEYIAGFLMIAVETLEIDPNPARYVTVQYETHQGWPVIYDADDWHHLRATGPPRNALYFNGWYADWYNEAFDF
jgi:prepilin-type N-terminal cleavage/methylation domain-containing protein